MEELYVFRNSFLEFTIRKSAYEELIASIVAQLEDHEHLKEITASLGFRINERLRAKHIRTVKDNEIHMPTRGIEFEGSISYSIAVKDGDLSCERPVSGSPALNIHFKAVFLKGHPAKTLNTDQVLHAESVDVKEIIVMYED